MKQAIGLAFLSIGYMLIAFGVKDSFVGEQTLTQASGESDDGYLVHVHRNKLAGQLATLYPDGSSKSLFGIIEIASLHDFFMMFVVLSGVAAIALACISPLLNRMMRE